ncbi:hypothetical protein BJY01DRAFT_254008 [Aspergillus pseudoustus]|uniref:Zn(2)-C6 fungal-type domain-containing protein n=1 Tax=Aspergillus pseudoustus TaxID=1810923 RepID=A0ABR4IWS6_9EURO
MARKVRACVPCHERKVRCDAIEVGTPCTRCVNAERTQSCALVPQEKLRSMKRKRQYEVNQHDRSAVISSHPSPARSEPIPPTPRFDSGITRNRESANPRLSVPDLPPVPPHRAGSVASFPALLAHSPFGCSSSPDSSPTQAGEPVGEDESQLQICREMSQWQSGQPPTAPTAAIPPTKGHEVIEYHGGMNSVTILSEVLGRAPPKRLVRIVLRDPVSHHTGPQLELNGLDEADMEYLQRKGAFETPAPEICDKFLRLYFQCVHVYTPVVDRVQFLQEYRAQTISFFLLHSVLASVAPYCPTSLIQEAGFDDYPSAQRTFINRARLLYDVGAERNQLRQLQGALLLSQVHVSLYTEKDYRYWLSNAMRIATKMGLHKDEVGRNVDLGLRRLLRRMWWVLYNRDALLVFNGLDNLRRIHDTDFDTAELTLDDWDEESVPAEFQDILPQVTNLQKHFLVASCGLSLTSARFIQALTRISTWSASTCMQLEEGMSKWRESLPLELRCSMIQEWTVENFWALVLDARSFVTECIMYRTMREAFKSRDPKISRRAAQRLQHAMLELDTTIDRIMVHNLVEYCPMYNCASTILALHIERSLSQALDVPARLLTTLRIQTDLEFLRQLSKSWWPISWAVQMFEVVIRRTGLSVSITQQQQQEQQQEQPFQPGSHDPFNSGFDANDAAAGLGNPTDILLSEIGLDLPFYPLDAPGGLANGENMFQEFLSGEQWNAGFVNL